jgi:hypothetical protein
VPLWLIALAALAAFGAYTWFSNPMRTTATVPTQKIMAGNVDLGGQMTTTIDQLRTALGTVKDAASAQAALPRLRDAATGFEKIQALSGQLPADGKKSLGGMAASALKILEPIIASVLGTSGVGTIVKPTLDVIKGRLEAMSKA